MPSVRHNGPRNNERLGWQETRRPPSQRGINRRWAEQRGASYLGGEAAALQTGDSSAVGVIFAAQQGVRTTSGVTKPIGRGPLVGPGRPSCMIASPLSAINNVVARVSSIQV